MAILVAGRKIDFPSGNILTAVSYPCCILGGHDPDGATKTSKLYYRPAPHEKEINRLLVWIATGMLDSL